MSRCTKLAWVYGKLEAVSIRLNADASLLDVVYMSRAEVEDILTESSQKIGSYILYEDLDKQKMYLALKPIILLISVVRKLAFLDPFLSTGQKSIRRQLADNRRDSSRTNSAASSCQVDQKPSFRKVDPDQEWTMSNMLTSLDICEDDEYLQEDELDTDYPKRKAFVASTPNIMFDCEYNSICGPTTMYLPNISRRYDYQESNADSTLTPESQFSSRVTIDSDSGYAVSVSNVKSKRISKDKRTKKKPHIASSFRILSDSPNENVFRSKSRERGLLEPRAPVNQLCTTSGGGFLKPRAPVNQFCTTSGGGLLEPQSPVNQSYTTRLTSKAYLSANVAALVNHVQVFGLNFKMEQVQSYKEFIQF
ncbi:hypothetical protein GQR58_020519 [Nymphon striatum]|nr:hypothetical protein GQR58_020519 [Nymphon striatum]